MGLVRSAPCWLGVLLVSASLQEAHQRTGVPGQRARAPAEESVQETEEVRILVVDREGRPLPDAEVRFALEDERGGSIRDDSQPGGRRQALRLEQPPRASAVEG